MSRVLPILFNTDMVRAILDDRKMVTRRLIKFLSDKNPNWTGYKRDGLILYNGKNEPCSKKPPYQVGDVLYVRETYRVGAWDVRSQMIAFDYKDGTCGELVYIHDRELFERLVNQSREDARKAKCEYNGADFVWKKGESPCRWRPSIHMPKEAARTWLKATGVRVERLQDITEEQALLEGCDSGMLTGPCTARGQFENLWNSTIKKSNIDRYGWDANPWVGAIEFERCEKPEERE